LNYIQNFNTSYVSVQVSLIVLLTLKPLISIHHMFRFKEVLSKADQLNHNFNTSYVSVQGYNATTSPNPFLISIHHMFRFKDIVLDFADSRKCISIHHMFRFKKYLFRVTTLLLAFQYIICFGSSW